MCYCTPRHLTGRTDDLCAGYAKRLREAGIAPEQAEAHAEAAREFVMGELVTRYDLERARRELDTKIDRVNQGLDAKIDQVNQGLEAKIDGVSLGLDGKIGGIRQELESQRREFALALERLTLQMTVRLGGMLAVAVAILATIMKL